MAELSAAERGYDYSGDLSPYDSSSGTQGWPDWAYKALDVGTLLSLGFPLGWLFRKFDQNDTGSGIWDWLTKHSVPTGGDGDFSNFGSPDDPFGYVGSDLGDDFEARLDERSNPNADINAPFYSSGMSVTNLMLPSGQSIPVISGPKWTGPNNGWPVADPDFSFFPGLKPPKPPGGMQIALPDAPSSPAGGGGSGPGGGSSGPGAGPGFFRGGLGPGSIGLRPGENTRGTVGPGVPYENYWIYGHRNNPNPGYGYPIYDGSPPDFLKYPGGYPIDTNPGSTDVGVKNIGGDPGAWGGGFDPASWANFNLPTMMAF